MRGQHAGTDAAVVGQLVIVGELLACADRPARGDVNAAIFFVGFAVGGARMVDPAGRVAAHGRVDHSAVVELENERVVRVVGVAVGTRLRDLPCRPFAAIFDDRRSLPDGAGREDAATMNAGSAVKAGQSTSARAWECWWLETACARTFAATASAKAPKATASEACNAVVPGELRSRTCSYPMWAANAAALITQAASRHVTRI